MAPQPTKGAWETAYSGAYGATVVRPKNALGLICVCSQRESAQEEEGNAHLISQSPLMLQGLSEIHNILSKWMAEKERENDPDLYAVREAIEVARVTLDKVLFML